MSCVVKDVWRVSYTTETNCSIKSCRVKRLAFDKFHLFASRIFT